MMKQQSSSTLETSARKAKKAARESARAYIRAVIAARRDRVRVSADKGEPPYLDIADEVPVIADATSLSQGEVNQLAGSEVAAELRPEFRVKSRRVELPRNAGGAKTAASYEQLSEEEVLES